MLSEPITDEQVEKALGRIRLAAETQQGRLDSIFNDIATILDYGRQAVDRLKAERDTLRLALEKIAAYPSGGMWEKGTPSGDRLDMIHMAREALRVK